MAVLLIAECVAIAIAVFLLIHKYWIESFNYWKLKSVQYVQPNLLFGNYKDVILSRTSEAELVQKLYCQLDGLRFAGLFQGNTPVLLIRDPDLVKQILVKDFAIFCSRGINFDKTIDTLSANLFNLEGDEWRSVRSKLTPAFTPRKQKCMFQIMDRYVNDLCNYLEGHAKGKKSIDIGEVLAKFSTDTICGSLFGLQVNAINDPKSEFYNIGRKIVNESENRVHHFFSFISGRLSKLISSQKGITSFFSSVARDILAFNEQNGTASTDFMHLLSQLAYTVDSQDLPEEVVAAQMYVCFLAGLEKPTSILSFCLYELATAPALQARLSAEVDDALRGTGGRLGVETLYKMPFLDKVVAETLRKYPVEAHLTRVCRQSYTIPGTTVVLSEGTKVIVPVFAIQRDPSYYPDPECFNPEREAGPPGTYLPFGGGPRKCLGYKLGLMQIKVGLATLLSKYEFTVSSKTTIPARLCTTGRVTSLAGRTWLKIALRATNVTVASSPVSKAIFLQENADLSVTSASEEVMSQTLHTTPPHEDITKQSELSVTNVGDNDISPALPSTLTYEEIIRQPESTVNNFIAEDLSPALLSTLSNKVILNQETYSVSGKKVVPGDNIRRTWQSTYTKESRSSTPPTMF